MMENLVDYENLIVDIVSRLPIESVLQCRCVCKRWRALLLNDYFIQIHTDRTLQQQQQQQLLDDHDDDYDSSSITPVSFFNLVYFPETDSHEFHVHDYYVNNKYISSRKIFRPPKHPPPSLTKEDEERRIDIKGYYSSLKQISWKIMGSCNGLICLYGLRRIYDANYYNTAPLIIYNPITREYLKLPPVDQSQSTIINKVFENEAYGFGYHPSTKEYKIVRVISQLQQSAAAGQAAAAAGSKSSYVRWVQIYTLGGGAGGSNSNSRGKWRIKKEEEEGDCLYSDGVPFNGVLYWKIGENMEERKIISFDLADKTFRIIRSPTPPPFFYPCCYMYDPHYGNVSFDYELGLLGQHLCATLRTHLTTDIWVMKRNIEDNIVECSWSKKFSIPAANLDMGLKSWNLSQTLKQPIGVTKKGRVLCIGDHVNLFIFDPITESTESLGCMHLFKCPSRKIPYTKSLVSLKALGEEGATIL